MRLERFNFNVIVVSCLKCGKRIAAGVFDKEGEAFKAYYCNVNEAELYNRDRIRRQRMEAKSRWMRHGLSMCGELMPVKRLALILSMGAWVGCGSPEPTLVGNPVYQQAFDRAVAIVSEEYRVPSVEVHVLEDRWEVWDQCGLLAVRGCNRNGTIWVESDDHTDLCAVIVHEIMHSVSQSLTGDSDSSHSMGWELFNISENQKRCDA